MAAMHGRQYRNLSLTVRHHAGCRRVAQRCRHPGEYHHQSNDGKDEHNPGRQNVFLAFDLIFRPPSSEDFS